MTIPILIAVIFLLVCFPLLRCLIISIHRVLYYAPIDAVLYILHREQNRLKTGELVAINGLFGMGKTLTAVHIIAMSYKKYDGKMVWCPERKKLVTQRVKIISNVALLIPYEKFVSLSQIVYCAENNYKEDMENDTLTVTLVLGDEFSVQLNSRSFKTNIDPLFLNTLLTCRHYHLSIYYTSQRFNQVDALLRQVTSYAIECHKTWRFQGVDYYDAWQLESSTSPDMIKPYRRKYWFVDNKDYEMYNTLATVINLSKSCKDGDMMTSEQILALQCNNPNMENVMSPSKKYRKMKKKLK
jgi:hypothetical protein